MFLLPFSLIPSVSFIRPLWWPLLITVDSSTHHSGYPTAYSGFLLSTVVGLLFIVADLLSIVDIDHL